MPSKILEDGDPYLLSAVQAFEGCSFSGYKVRFVSEKQCVASNLDDVKVLVLPHTPALGAEAFVVLDEYIEEGGIVVRTSSPVLYDERGHSRRDIITNTSKTVLVRGMNLPTEYLHAMDAVTSFGDLSPIPRTTNEYGFPLEGVKSRYVEIDGQGYLYALNIRKRPVTAHVLGAIHAGRDLIHGRDVAFPMQLEPLEPMLVCLDMPEVRSALTPDIHKAAESLTQ